MKRKRRYLNIILLMVLLFLAVSLSKKGITVMKNVLNMTDNNREKIIVLDAGHGGIDSGKLGINGSLEKEINLTMVFKIKKLLEQNDVKVIMTRTDDNGLYIESDSNKKNADLKKRVEIIENSNAIFAVSIHQNSFEQENSKGAQVFYYKSSLEGRQIAQVLQEQIKRTVKDENKRKAKANESYYMLRKTKCPLVIVECGFLSNREEAELLCNEEYQDKMAWAIHLGILSSLEKIK